MDIASALAVLGLTDGADWAGIRTAHRDAIRRAHPDAGGQGADAALINQAFQVLDRATASGARPLPSPPESPSTPRLSPHRVTGSDDPAEVLMLLAEAGHDIGDVVFVDPLAGILEIIVGDAPGVASLAVVVSAPTQGQSGVPVAFTLEPLGVAPAPPIHEVVAPLMSRVRDAHSSGSRRPG